MSDVVRHLPLGGLWFSGWNTVSAEWKRFGFTVYRGQNLTTLNVYFGKRKFKAARFRHKRSRRWSMRSATRS